MRVLAALAGVVVAVSAARAQSGEPILIGAHLDVAKQASYYSLLQRDSIDAFVKVKNAEGGVNGRPLKVLYEDDELNPTIAAQKVERLASQGVVALLSISGSAAGLAAQAKAEELHIPIVSGNTAERLTTVPPKRYYFRFGLRDSVGALALADFMRRKGASPKVAMVRDATETGILVSDGMIAQLKAAGIEIAELAQITPGSTDVTAQALRIRRLAPDFVILAGSSTPDIANYVKAHASLGIRASLLGSFVFGTQAFIDLVGKAGDGFVFTDVIDFSRPEVAAVLKQLTPVLGEKGKGLGTPTQSWEMMRLVVDAIQRGGATREGVRDALETTRNWSTAIGSKEMTVNFDQNWHDLFASAGEVVLRELRDGEYRTLARSD